MNKLFYARLAADNIKKNSKTYLPYMLTCCFTVAMCYIISSLSSNVGIDELLGSVEIRTTLGLGRAVTGIFAFIFLFYTNSFLMKRRKKEFGLFNILGMEKKHLARVIGLETLYIGVISLVLGLGAGILLDKIMYLLLLKLLGIEVPLGFYISTQAIFMTLFLFIVIYASIFLNSLRQIHLAKPIELLHSGNVGEKEPKTKWFITILGILCLGGGYYISVTTENPMVAISIFFVAVILVIVGTYLLFTAGSIALLKMLRKNKKYYYQTKHFISVSGMIYRMKQNAIGLANICILSTMVLVMISSTGSMIGGLNSIIENRYPNEISVYANVKDLDKATQILADSRSFLEKNQITAEKEEYYSYLNFSIIRKDDQFIVNSDYQYNMGDEIENLIFTPLEEYNRITGENKSLEKGQVLMYSTRGDYEYDTLQIADHNYQVLNLEKSFVKNGVASANIADTRYVVVNDMQELNSLYDMQKAAYGEESSEIEFYFGVDLACDEEQELTIYQNMNTFLSDKEEVFNVESRAESRQGMVSLYGGLFFIGIFLGVLFIMATILIIYYKQISEGYDDRERFVIMQKVGMSKKEVRGSIHSQIVTVFFLPLITAGIHVAFAFPFIARILGLLNLTNTTLFIFSTIGCFVVFALLYSIIYGVTAKVYYQIVSR